MSRNSHFCFACFLASVQLTNMDIFMQICANQLTKITCYVTDSVHLTTLDVSWVTTVQLTMQLLPKLQSEHTWKVPGHQGTLSSWAWLLRTFIHPLTLANFLISSTTDSFLAMSIPAALINCSSPSGPGKLVLTPHSLHAVFLWLEDFPIRLPLPYSTSFSKSVLPGEPSLFQVELFPSLLCSHL